MDNVEVVERGKITVNIYEGQKGEKGEAGKALRFEDLTTEQKEELKGEKGDKGDGASASSAYHLLVSRGYLPSSDSVEDVLTYIVDKSSMFYDKLQGLQIALRQLPKYGDTTVQLGLPNIGGMIIKEQGTDKTYTCSDNAQFSTPLELSHPMDEHSVTLEAIWQGEVKSTLVIPGVQATTPVEIAYDPAYTNSEVNGNIEYATPDDQLWLRQTKSPSLFSARDVGQVVGYSGVTQYNTVVLDLIAKDMIELGDSGSTLGIDYRDNNGDGDSMLGDKSLIISPQDFNIHFNNLIVVYSDKPVRSRKSTITFIAPSNIHVGTAVKGTTSVPCITANQGDVVQIDIANRTAKIIGTNGTEAIL